MSYRDSVDTGRARRQWDGMVAALEDAGAVIEVLDSSRHSPAQVFTADGAIVLGRKHALVLRNDGPRGSLEPRNLADWLRADGFTVESIPPNRTLDGGNSQRLHDGSFACGLKPGADGSGASDRAMDGAACRAGAATAAGRPAEPPSKGSTPRSASRSFAMCSGVVPQQPPRSRAPATAI